MDAMGKVSVVWDLIAGLLISIDIIALPIGQRGGKWLIEHLPRRKDFLKPFNVRTIGVVVITTLLLTAITISLAVSKGESSSNNVQWVTVGWFVLGTFSAVVSYLLLTLAISWLHKRRHLNKISMADKTSITHLTLADEAGQIALMCWLFFWLGIIVLPLLSLATGSRTFLADIIIMFTITIWILTILLFSVPRLTSYLMATPEKPYYALARIGIIIFVVSKIIELMF